MVEIVANASTAIGSIGGDDNERKQRRMDP